MITKFNDRLIDCPKCHKNIKPKIDLNRAKGELIGTRYSRKDKAYLMVCPHN
jgi:hypothetical protein